MTCTICGLELTIGMFPCIKTIRPHGVSSFNVIDDSIIGGFTQENFGNRPEVFYSKQAMARRAKELGLEPLVRHVGKQGSDKSDVTTRWV